jgi:hypothetical protein
MANYRDEAIVGVAKHMASLAEQEQAELKYLLHRAVIELSYIQSVENCGSGLCATAEGEWIVKEGMKLLGLKDLSEEPIKPQ